MRRARAQPTPERSVAFDWTPPILRIPSVIIVRAGTPGDFTVEALAGKRVAEELRRRRPGLPVLYMSGYAADALADGNSLDARSGFLAKPFTSPTLLRRVRDVLDYA